MATLLDVPETKQTYKFKIDTPGSGLDPSYRFTMKTALISVMTRKKLGCGESTIERVPIDE